MSVTGKPCGAELAALVALEGRLEDRYDYAIIDCPDLDDALKYIAWGDVWLTDPSTPAAATRAASPSSSRPWTAARRYKPRSW